MRRLLVMTCLLAVTACTAPAPVPPPSPSPATVEEPGVRDCDSSVYGELGPDFRDTALIVGPLAFARWYSDEPAWFDSIPTQSSGLRFVKVLVTVDPGKRATITVPPSERADVELSYRSGRDYAITFIACEDVTHRATQFNGGFMLRSPRCVPIDVAFDGRTERVVMSFGAGKC